MQVEQIDRDAVKREITTTRERIRAEVVGEIVAWMKDKASYAWSRESELADQIEAKFGKTAND